MVYCNHSSLMILVSDAKYIHFYPTFQLPPTLSHCKYKPFIKSIELSLFLISLFIYSLFQILAKTFLSNLIIDLSYNLNKYMQFEVFENCLKRGCLHLHTVLTLYGLGRNRKLLKFCVS